MPHSRSVLFSAAVIGAFTLTAFAAEAACYNPNAQRDKFIGGWVAWVPEKGAQAEWKGKSFNRAQAIKTAKADITKGYADRGAEVDKSPAAMAAFAVMDSGGVNTRAKRKYGRAGLDVTFEDAVSCWLGYAK